MTALNDAGNLVETQSKGGMPELIGELPSSSGPHCASWQLLLEDAATADLARPAGEPQCLQLGTECPALQQAKVQTVIQATLQADLVDHSALCHHKAHCILSYSVQLRIMNQALPVRSCQSLQSLLTRSAGCWCHSVHSGGDTLCTTSCQSLCTAVPTNCSDTFCIAHMQKQLISLDKLPLQQAHCPQGLWHQDSMQQCPWQRPTSNKQQNRL